MPSIASYLTASEAERVLRLAGIGTNPTMWSADKQANARRILDAAQRAKVRRAANLHKDAIKAKFATIAPPRHSGRVLGVL